MFVIRYCIKIANGNITIFNHIFQNFKNVENLFFHQMLKKDNQIMEIFREDLKIKYFLWKYLFFNALAVILFKILCSQFIFV